MRSHRLQGCTQGDQNAAIPLRPKRPKMAQVNILLDITKNKATFDYKRLVFITCYLFITYKRNPISFQKWGTSLKLGTSQTSLSGSAIDDPSTCRRFFSLQNSLFIPNQSKAGTVIDSPCQIFQKCSLTFRNGPTSMTTRLIFTI